MCGHRICLFPRKKEQRARDGIEDPRKAETIPGGDPFDLAG